jgi:hypothetical protein
MYRTTAVALAAAAALSLAACGASDSGVSPETAKTKIENAAGLHLTAVPVTDEAKQQGLRATYDNAATITKDKQVVGLFVLKDAGVADAVADQVKGSAPAKAHLIRHGSVMVVYAPAGADHAAEIRRAVEGL